MKHPQQKGWKYDEVGEVSLTFSLYHERVSAMNRPWSQNHVLNSKQQTKKGKLKNNVYKLKEIIYIYKAALASE